MEMGSVAQGWLAYELTGSAIALGGISSVRSIARLFLSLYAGALADRFRKRSVLLITRALMILNALTLSILILSGSVRVWHLVGYSLLSGIISSFMMPAQQAILPEIVGRRSLMNALSLTSVGRGVIGIVAATAAGYVIALIGAGSVYATIALLYALALFSISQLAVNDAVGASHGSLSSELRGGLQHLRTSPVIPTLLIIALVRVVLGWSYRTLMPVYAKEVMGFDARGLGVLTAAPSIGSLLSSVALAFLGDSRRKGLILVVSGMLMGIALLAFGALRSLPLVLVSLGLLGAARNAAMVSNNTLVQVSCAAEFRGRIMAMYMMLMGMMPLGTIPSAALADSWGVPPVLMLQGALLVAIFGALWIAIPQLRKLA
jgi:MFS family permease